MSVTAYDLKPYEGPGPHPILYCNTCGAECSANANDYFMHPSSYAFKCCDEDMWLVMKRTTIEVITKGGDKLEELCELLTDCGAVMFIHDKDCAVWQKQPCTKECGARAYEKAGRKMCTAVEPELGWKCILANHPIDKPGPAYHRDDVGNIWYGRARQAAQGCFCVCSSCLTQKGDHPDCEFKCALKQRKTKPIKS